MLRGAYGGARSILPFLDLVAFAPGSREGTRDVPLEGYAYLRVTGLPTRCSHYTTICSRTCFSCVPDSLSISMSRGVPVGVPGRNERRQGFGPVLAGRAPLVFSGNR